MCGTNRLDSGSHSGKGLIILTSVCLVPLWTWWVWLSIMWRIIKLKGPIADCLNQSKPQASSSGLVLPWLGDDLPENPLLLFSPGSTRKNSVLAALKKPWCGGCWKKQRWADLPARKVGLSRDVATNFPELWGVGVYPKGHQSQVPLIPLPRQAWVRGQSTWAEFENHI